MKNIQKYIQNFYTAVGIIVAVIGIFVASNFAVTQVNQTAHAAPGWCPNNSMDLKTAPPQCVQDLYNSMPDKRGLTEQQLTDLSLGCQSSSGGVGVHEGSCVNAVVYCYEHASAVSECTNSAMLKSIADKCNQGAGTSHGVCSDLQQANNEQYQNAYNDAIAKASSTCTTTNGNTSTQKSNCIQGVCTTLDSGSSVKGSDCKSPACQIPSSYSSDTWSNTVNVSGQTAGNDLSNFQNCLNSALLNSSKDATECQQRGGEPQTDTKGNFSGCKIASPPPTYCPTPQNPPNTQPDQNGLCPDGSSVNDAGGPGTTTSTVKGGCGQAKTNLINCDTNARGGEVLSTVLQYVVQALSILVGIGAVGGIVWESIQYAQAQDDQGTVSNARKRIRDIVIGLFVYGFMIAIINWLVPGGVIK